MEKKREENEIIPENFGSFKERNITLNGHGTGNRGKKDSWVREAAIERSVLIGPTIKALTETHKSILNCKK